jgi:probable FeS assembly SUF system protein SufT
MDRVELARDCEAVQVPAGQIVSLNKGTEIFVTQSLGGSYTVQVPQYGGLFRISGRDADALGIEGAQAAAQARPAADGDLEAMVWEQLKTCYDPEIPVNIVDLGLIYAMSIAPKPDGAKTVDIKMTLTAQGCGMGASIAFDAKQKLLDLPGVSEANVEVVWDPPWNPQMISPKGKERLGLH